MVKIEVLTIKEVKFYIEIQTNEVITFYIEIPTVMALSCILQ